MSMPEKSQERQSPTNYLTFRLARVQNLLNAQAASTLRSRSDLSLTEWRVMSLIVGEGSTSAAAISKLAHMDKGQVSRAIKSLATRQYVRTETDLKDHRQTILTATNKAIQTYDELSLVMQRRQSLLATDISDEERANFLSTLRKLEARARETVG